MKKWLLAITLIICLLGFGVAQFNGKPSESDAEIDGAYVQRKLGISFDATKSEVYSFFYAIADQQISLKLWLLENDTPLEQTLIDLGWNTGMLPIEFTTERVLDAYNRFDKELLSCCEYFDCLWTYTDEYAEFYGRKEDFGRYRDYVYGSPNYHLAAYIPECKLLFYKEYNS